MSSENKDNDKITREEVEAFATKLNNWAQGLPAEEKALVNILVSDAKFFPKDPRCCPDVRIIENIEGTIVEALESTIGTGKVKEGGYQNWSRTSGMS